MLLKKHLTPPVQRSARFVVGRVSDLTLQRSEMLVGQRNLRSSIPRTILAAQTVREGDAPPTRLFLDLREVDFASLGKSAIIQL